MYLGPLSQRKKMILIHFVYFQTSTEKEIDFNPFNLLPNIHRERKIILIHLNYFQTATDKEII
jgi:hypothetical protein